MKGGSLGFFNIHSVAKYQKNEGDLLETLINFRKKSYKAKRGGESFIVPKHWNEGPFCFGMVLYFMFAFKIKHYVLLVKVHEKLYIQLYCGCGLTKNKSSLCNSRALFTKKSKKQTLLELQNVKNDIILTRRSAKCMNYLFDVFFDDFLKSFKLLKLQYFQYPHQSET